MENMKCSFILQLQSVSIPGLKTPSHTHTMGSMQLGNSSLLEGRAKSCSQMNAVAIWDAVTSLRSGRLYLGHGGLGQSGVMAGALLSQEK